MCSLGSILVVQKKLTLPSRYLCIFFTIFNILNINYVVIDCYWSDFQPFESYQWLNFCGIDVI